MTTKNSPLSELKRQADKMAKMLKMAERGELTNEKIVAAREKGIFTVGLVMDDKFIKMELPWKTIQDFGEVALSEFIVKHMREIRSNN